MAKITVATRQSRALELVENAHRYILNTEQIKQLAMLSRPPNPDDVVRIVPSISLTTRCNQCLAENIPVADFELCVSLCLTCLKEAVFELEKEVSQRLCVNTILLTRDGRFTGNALVVKVEPYIEIITDYGNRVKHLTMHEIDEMYYISNVAEPDHKHFVVWAES